MKATCIDINVSTGSFLFCVLSMFLIYGEQDFILAEMFLRKLLTALKSVSRWRPDNTYIRTDHARNIKPDRDKSAEKNGADTIIMGSQPCDSM